MSAEQRKTFCSGWRPVRPAAAYVIPSTPFVNKKKKALTEVEPAVSSRHVTFHSAGTAKPTDIPYYMNGGLDEDYCYTYRGGLSSVTHPAGSLYKHFPTQTRSTIELEPVAQYRYPDPSTQIDISRIVSMQLKPEVLVEQLLIENRLRTMSMAALPTLNLEGIGVSADKSTKKSDSAPLLRKSSYQSVKKRRSKVQTPLEWCHLAADQSPQLDRGGEQVVQAQTPINFSFDNFSYSQQRDGLHFRHRLNPDPNAKTSVYSTASCKPSERKANPQQQTTVHVVQPLLDRTLPVYRQQRDALETNSPHTLTSLLKLWKNTPVRF